MTKAERQASIFEELEKLRNEFDSIVYPEYYRLMPEPKLLKSYFIENCELGQDLELHQSELRKAIFLDGVIRFFEGELARLDPKLIRTAFDLECLNLVINDLIAIMAPGAGIMAQLKNAFDQAALSLKNRKPILFIEKDLIDAFCRIFLSSIRHLQELLDHQPVELKAQYAACQIRKLDYLEVTAQKNGQALNLCIANLKKIFQSELQYKEHQDQCRQVPREAFLSKEREAPVTEPLSFGYKKSPGFLRPYIEALNLQIGFLDARTSVDDFIRIITSDDLGLIKDKIYLGCQTNEFRYLIKYFKPFFKSFTPATIGKSGLFISNLGNLITADCLYNCKSEKLQTKLGIDNIFNKRG